MNNITSIINSFESGSFYRGNKNYSCILFSDTQAQLRDILIWINSNLTPGFLSGIRDFDESTTTECLALASILRENFRNIVVALKRKRKGKKYFKNESFAVNAWTKTNFIPTSHSCGFWRDLQHCHEHVEHSLALTSEWNKLALPTNLDVIENSVDADNIANIDNLNTDISPEICTNTKVLYLPSVEMTDITLNCLNETTPTLSCTYCDCSNNNFKFNFIVDYDPTLKRALYGSHEYLEVIEIDGILQSTIQLRNSSTFSCLICNISSDHNRSLRSLQEHINGQKHKKNKVPLKLQDVSIFHKMWIKREKSYQPHQALFFPAGPTSTVCSVCCTQVEYDHLEQHIVSDSHKSFVIQLYQNDSCVLMQLLASIYLPELNSVINCDKLHASIDRPHSQQKMPVRFENGADEAETSVQSDKKTVTHNIVKSIANPLGKSLLADVLEHRFWPHLHLLEIVSSTGEVECRCCDSILPNNPLIIKEHLYSENHILKCNLPQVNWRYYCEVCDFYCSRHSRWQKHLLDSKHNKCYCRLSASRKTKLCEYECTTCNVVIFGDEISIHRHTNARERKKVIVLNKEIKEAFKSEQHIQNLCNQLVAIANGVLNNPDAMIKCCKAIEDTLSETFENCKAHPFGSRVSGLGNEKSDLDVFVDAGGMYFGLKNQDPQAQGKFVKIACKIFRKNNNEFSHLNPIPTARTPIVQIFHKGTNIDCDISFRHGLSVENSKFLRFCNQVQPVTQSLILFLKRWVLQCNLNEYITTYALAMLVIFFLQVTRYLLPVHELKMLNPDNTVLIDGWCIPDFSGLEDVVRSRIINNDKSIKQLLIDFFVFYETFDYENNVVCPLLGYTVKKSVFLSKGNENLPLEMLAYAQKVTNPTAEEFRAKSQFCIQDPFDLSHNLTKACHPGVVTKFMTYCFLSSKHLKTVP